MRFLRQVHRVAPSLLVIEPCSQELLPGEQLVGGCKGFLPVRCWIGSGLEVWWVLQSGLEFLPSLDQTLGEHLVKPFMIS
jgi:hypothetical protein